MYLFVHTRWAHLYLAHINTFSSFIYSNTYQARSRSIFFPIWGVEGFLVVSTGWKYFPWPQAFFYLIENFQEDQRTWLSSCDRLPL